jgi:hypothetical protein
LAQVVPPEGSEGGNDAEDEEFDPSDTLDVQEDEPLTPDTTQAAPPPPSPADTAGFVPSTMDTSGAPAAADTSAAGIDTLRGTFVPVTPDSATAAKRAAAAADSGVGDTLFTPKPGPQAPAQAPPKKPRSGILGIHPIVILLGLVALHYFVTKTTGD